MKYGVLLCKTNFPPVVRIIIAGFCTLLIILPNTRSSSAEVQREGDSRPIVKQSAKLIKKGKLGEAEKLLKETLLHNPNDPAAKVGFAYLLLKQRDFLQAYKYSFEVAQAQPKNSRAFAVLGMALLDLGRFSDAEICFRHSLGLNKDEDLAWFGHGLLDYYENRIASGLVKIFNARYLQNDEPDYLFAYAQISTRAEKYKEAAEAYEAFLRVSPQSDTDRRQRIEGLINFLQYLGSRQKLYQSSGNSATVVPVQLKRDRPVIQVRINGMAEPLSFLVDTGSPISVISQATADKLQIKSVARGGLARGLGGVGKFEIVYGFLRSLSVGDVKIDNVPVYIRPLHNNEDQVDGFIGLSLISKFLTTIDYGNSTFILRRIEAGPTDDLSIDDPSVPLRLTSSGFLSGEVRIGGIETPLNFIVDTGATTSVISNDLAAIDEIRKFISPEKSRVVGSAGVTENVESFMLPRVTFGKSTREKIAAVALNLDIINEASGFEQAGILGGNFLKNYRLTFDFKNSKVTFVPVNVN
jgi:tetratricopeptide (TPR) repeat protein